MVKVLVMGDGNITIRGSDCCHRCRRHLYIFNALRAHCDCASGCVCVKRYLQAIQHELLVLLAIAQFMHASMLL